MANEELGLRLTAQITEWLANLTKAATAADGLKNTVLELEQSVKRAFAGIEAISRQSGGKMVGAFVGAAREMDKAATAIEGDAKRTAVALGTVGKAAAAADRAVNSAVGGIASGTKGIGAAADSAARSTATGLGGIEASVGKIGERIKGSILNIRNALLGLGALRFGQAAVGAASDFEAALGQLAIVANDTGVPIGQLKQQLLDLSKTTPLALGDLTKAYATAVGSLPKGANQAKVAFEALNAAQLAARASGATTEETLRGITAVLNTYGDTGITAAQITDKLFATFDQGAATVPDLTASIGQVAGIAKSFGISIDEVFGTIAVLTRGGQTASEAITNLRQALISTANGGAMEKVAGQLKAIGLSAELFSAQSLRQNGLIGVLEQVEKAGGKPLLNKLYTDTQGFLAVSTLLSTGLKQTRDDIDGIGKSAGKTDQAVATISDNFDQLAGIAKNKLGAAMIEIGERIMPTVAKVLGQVADYAEKNGAAIADGIGKAVEVLVRFGEWVVSYGPQILLFFGTLKVTSFFASLALDVGKATSALVGFVQQYRASQALGQGLAALGAEGGAKFSTGFMGKVKGLGPALSGLLRSPGTLGLVVGAGVLLGEELGAALGTAAGEAIYGPMQRAIEASTKELEIRTQASLARFGAANAQELEEARNRQRTGEVVDTGGRGNVREFKTLQDVGRDGGDVSAAFNAGLQAINQQVGAAQARIAAQVSAMGGAAAKVEELKRRQIGGAELAEAEVAFGAIQAGVRADAAAVEKLQAGSVALVRQYSEVTKAAGATGKATANAVTKGAGAAKATADTFLTDLVKEYEDGQARLAALRLEGQRLAAEFAQNETDAMRAAFEAETDARIGALQDADVKESQIADARIERERQMATVIDTQIAAIEQMARVRVDEARAAAAAEIEAAKGSAEAQALIAQNLALEESTIEADRIARTEELRRASSQKLTEEERAASKARAEEAIQAQEAAAAANQGQRAAVQAQRFAQLATPEGASDALAQFGASGGEGAGLGGILGGGALSGAAGAIAVLPAISAGLKGIGDLFGGDVEELRKKARSKEAEAAKIEKQLARLPATATPEEKKALEERLSALRKESEELRNAAEAAKGGLETFFEDFATNAQNALVGLLEGLPQAVDRILSVVIPAFVESVIASFPEMMVAFQMLLPRIAWSLARSIAYVLPIALYDGVVKAGEAMIKFFTTGTVEAIGDGIVDAFGVVTEGLKTAFTWIVDKIKALLPGGSTSEIVGALGGVVVGGLLGGPVGAAIGGYLGNEIGNLFHQGGVVQPHSNPHMASALAASGAQRFANGGMVNGLNNIARRRMSQLLSGDDVPILAAPGEGVLTAQGVHAVGGPVGVDAINRGNHPGGAMGAQVMISARLGGDRALAALVARLVSVSVLSPAGTVRAALDQSGIATSVPAYAGLR